MNEVDEAFVAMNDTVSRHGLTHAEWHDRYMAVIQSVMSDDEKRRAQGNFLRANTAHKAGGQPLLPTKRETEDFVLPWYRGENPEKVARNDLARRGRQAPPYMKPIK